jgi:hypothetical protein
MSMTEFFTAFGEKPEAKLVRLSGKVEAAKRRITTLIVDIVAQENLSPEPAANDFGIAYNGFAQVTGGRDLPDAKCQAISVILVKLEEIESRLKTMLVEARKVAADIQRIAAARLRATGIAATITYLPAQANITAQEVAIGAADTQVRTNYGMDIARSKKPFGILADRAEALVEEATAVKVLTDTMAPLRTGIDNDIAAMETDAVTVAGDVTASKKVTDLLTPLKDERTRCLTLSFEQMKPALDRLKKRTDLAKSDTNKIAGQLTSITGLRTDIEAYRSTIPNAIAALSVEKVALSKAYQDLSDEYDGIAPAADADALIFQLQEIKAGLKQAEDMVAIARDGGDALVARRTALDARLRPLNKYITEMRDIAALVVSHIMAEMELTSIVVRTDTAQNFTDDLVDYEAKLNSHELQITQNHALLERARTAIGLVDPDLVTKLENTSLVLPTALRDHAAAFKSGLRALEGASSVPKVTTAVVKLETAAAALVTHKDACLASLDIVEKIDAAVNKAEPLPDTVKLAGPKGTLKTDLNTLKTRRTDLSTIADHGAFDTAANTLKTDAEAFGANIKRVTDSLEKIDRDLHSASLAIAELKKGTADDLKVRYADLSQRAKTLAGTDTADLATKAAALRQECIDLSDDSEQRAQESLDLGKTITEIAKVGADIRVALSDPAIVSPDKDSLLQAAARYENVATEVARENLDKDKAAIVYGHRKMIYTHLQAAQTLVLQNVGGGNSQAIDQLVAKFNGETKKPEDDALCRAALQVRFNKKLEVPHGTTTVRIAKLYDLLASVPEEHVRLNDSLTDIDFKMEPPIKGNYYSSSRKAISLNGMREDDTPIDYKADSGSKFTPTYYDSTTLHEVGHAVDDRFGCMDSKGSLSAYGGWKKEELESVAAAYGLHGDKGGFIARYTPKGASKGDLTTLLKEALQGITSTKPANGAAALGSLLGQWDKIIGDATYLLCKQVAEQFEPWDKGKELATKAAVAGRFYFEAYPGFWYSYEIAARGPTGVSRYQWRAPGEWFAELYAVYHLKRDKFPNIMLKKWLDGQTPV